MTRPPTLRYAPDAEVDRMIELARRHGVKVGGLVFKGDGTVQILDAAAVNDKGEDDEISRKSKLLAERGR